MTVLKVAVVGQGAGPTSVAGPVTPLVAVITGQSGEARIRACLELAGDLLLAYPRVGLSAEELLRLTARLVELIAGAQQRERSALLAVCAVLADRLPVEVRDALRTLIGAGPEAPSEVAPAVAVHVCSLLAEGFPLSDQLLVDLAALVRSEQATRLIADRRPNRWRAMSLVLAAARG